MNTHAAQIVSSPRRRPLLLAMTLSAAAVLSACGGGGSGGTEVIPPPPVNAAELAVLVKPIANPVPSGSLQTMATVKLSNIGKGVAGTSDFNITADAVLQDLKVVNCKSDNAASACPATGSRMTVSNLQPGASLTFDLVGMVKLGTSSTVNVAASASTSNGGHMSSSSQSVGFKAYSVDVAVQATGPSTSVPPGGAFAYVLTVSNKGPDASTDARLGIDLLSNPAASAPTLGTITCSASGGALCPTELKVGVMELPSLPKDGTLVFTLPYRFAPGITQGLLFNTSVRASADTDSRNDSVLIMTP